MGALKFIPGIILLQVMTVIMVIIFNFDISTQDWMDWLRLFLPLGIIALLTAFWFNSLETRKHHNEITRLKEKHASEREQIRADHANEREKIRVNAERAKTRVMKDTHKEMRKEIGRTSAKANFKVGAALAGVVAGGAFLLMTQFMTLGVMMLTAAGGTAGGYVLRMRQEHKRLATDNQNAVLPPKDKPKILPE